ncbi:MAG: ADP-ribosylation/crystallin J1 [Chloroflexota bacterium]
MYKTLYRPVGLKELNLIIESDWSAFPPRLDWQPIFYPVLNQPYAEQIARDWNTKDSASDYVGFVTAFDVDTEYLSQFEEHIVGGSQHKELWIPAEELTRFNSMIQGKIRLAAVFYGDKYSGKRDYTISDDNAPQNL